MAAGLPTRPRRRRRRRRRRKAPCRATRPRPRNSRAPCRDTKLRPRRPPRRARYGGSFPLPKEGQAAPSRATTVPPSPRTGRGTCYSTEDGPEEPHRPNMPPPCLRRGRRPFPSMVGDRRNTRRWLIKPSSSLTTRSARCTRQRRTQRTEDTKPTSRPTRPPPAPIDPTRLLAADLDQYRQRVDVSNTVAKVMGGSFKTFGTPAFQGPSVSAPKEPTFGQDPSLFRDRLAEAFRMAGMGALTLEPDTPAAAGPGNVMKAWPDRNTPLRFSILYNLLSKSTAVSAAITSGTDVMVQNLNGDKCRVRYEHVSFTDALRLLVEEFTRGGQPVAHAQRALTNISLQAGGSWQTGLNRRVQLTRAASVNPNSPYLAKEPYFSMVLKGPNLQHLLNRAVKLSTPAALDQSTFHSQVVHVMQQNTGLLRYCNSDTHALGSPFMRERGQRIKDIYANFGSVLAEQAAYYATPTAASTRTSMSALQTSSPRLPPGEGTFSRHAMQRASLSALRDADPMDDDSSSTEGDDEDGC